MRRSGPRLKLREDVELVREHPLQRQIAEMLTLEIAPAGHLSKAGVVWWSIDQAVPYADDPRMQAWLKARAARGVIRGVPDVYLLYQGRAHKIELKAEDGVLGADQRAVAHAVIEAGGRIGVARNWAEVVALLDVWAIPRNRRTRIAA